MILYLYIYYRNILMSAFIAPLKFEIQFNFHLNFKKNKK